jgi:photosystem II stability/assembly factor-like uncharacterized protein
MRYLGLFLLSLFLVNCQDNTPEITTQIHDSSQKPNDWMFMQRAYPSGQINPQAQRNAMTSKEIMNVTAGNWSSVGPINIGGRISDIEMVSGQEFYVAAASGGVFKTQNGGADWSPIFDGQNSLSIGDIAIDPSNSNRVWVGTGEVNAGGGSLAYDGDGIYVSDDAGMTWTNKGLSQVGNIGKVLIDPNNPDRIYVGAMGPLFRNDSNRGVYLSEDGGDTWTQSLFVSDSTGIVDMAIHPTNGQIAYAAAWQRVRRPQYRSYGGETSGLFRTIDGGNTWEELTNGLPTAASQKGRISVVIAPSNPQVLYARYADAIGSIQGVYRSDDGGDSWVTMNSSALNNVGFHWWFRGVVVDPTDENTIYNVDFQVQKSTDGGNTWFGVFNNVHVDQHALVFDPNDPNRLVLGNDGGVYFSPDGGTTWTKDQQLPITQLYRCFVDPSNALGIYLGAQDNSTHRSLTGGPDDYEIIYGGDGFQPLVDPDDSNVIFAQYQYGNIAKSTNNGVSFTGATAGISGGDRKNWDTPIVFDPQNSEVMYTATQRVYRTENAAGLWNAISGDLTNGSGGGNLNYGTVVALDVSPFNAEKILAGTDDGNVWMTLDTGANWQLISEDLPTRWVTKVLHSVTHPGTLFVGLSGYRYGGNDGHVYKSYDNGQNWIDISSGLPDVPVNDVVQDQNGRLFVGTDIGVFGSADGGETWSVIGTNLPSVVVNDMHIHQPTQELFIATYGRSSYRIGLNEITLGTPMNDQTSNSVLWPNPARGQAVLKIDEIQGPIQVSLYGVQGTVLRTFVCSDQNCLLDLEGLAPGLYLLNFEQSAQKSSVKLLVQ